jgi:hypothetical protein
LGVLINCLIHVAPSTCDAEVGLIDEPSVAHSVAARSSCVDEFWCEAFYPAVDGDVIDFDAAFCE